MPISKQNTEHSLIQESDDDDEDSGSPSSNMDMFACESNSLSDNSLSATPDARSGIGNARSFPEFDQGTMMLDSIQPFDLTLQHGQGTPSTYMPITESYNTSLQDGFSTQNPGGVIDAFAIDYRWNEDAIALSPVDVCPESIDTQIAGQAANGDRDSCTVLTLYNAEPGTLNSILDMAFRSKIKIKMETYH